MRSSSARSPARRQCLNSPEHMTIKQIMLDALRFIGREEIAADILSGAEPYGEAAETADTLLYCVNAVEDELARYYFPLKRTDALHSEDKTFGFEKFSRTPVKILKVEEGRKQIEYELELNRIIADANNISVTYFYAPKKKTIDDDSEFGDMADGMITAYGAAAEFCIIQGEAARAEAFETRYREAIDRAQRSSSKGAAVPPRRWI